MAISDDGALIASEDGTRNSITVGKKLLCLPTAVGVEMARIIKFPRHLSDCAIPLVPGGCEYPRLNFGDLRVRYRRLATPADQMMLYFNIPSFRATPAEFLCGTNSMWAGRWAEG